MNRAKAIIIGCALVSMLLTLATGAPLLAQPAGDKYASPSNSVLPPSDMKLELGRTALVITDPQIDFLSPDGVTWSLVGNSVQELDTVKNLGLLFAGAKKAGIMVAISPHKVYGPEQNDLVLQLRKQGVDQVILAGMSANLCVEAHLRELLENGFEVAVVRDATAAAQIPDGDGYRAALTNFRMMANAVWTTGEILARLTEREEQP